MGTIAARNRSFQRRLGEPLAERAEHPPQDQVRVGQQPLQLARSDVSASRFRFASERDALLQRPGVLRLMLRGGVCSRGPSSPLDQRSD